MADADDTENSGDSDATEGETNEGEGDGSDETTDDNETPVIDPSEETGEDDSEETDPTETEVPGEADVSNETEVIEDEEDTDEVSVNDSSVNALIPAEQTVTVVEPDPTTEDPNNTKDLSSAVITYTNGCVSNGKIRKDADITFKVEAKDGRTLTRVAYKTKTGDAAESTAKTISPSDGVYTVPKADLMHDTTKEDGTKEKVNDTSVTIIVTTAEVEYALKADIGSSVNYKLYHTVTADNKTTADASKEIAAGSTEKILYSKKGDDVSFAVKANAGAVGMKIRKVSVAADGGAEKVLTSEKVTDDTEKNPIYTFKPSDLTGLAATENQDITIKVEATTAARITIDTTGVSEGATLAEVTNASAKYTEAGSFVQAGGNDAASYATEGQKVIFAVNLGAEYKALEEGNVTAELDGNLIDVEAVDKETVGEGTDAKEVSAHYMIDLADVSADAYLYINVKTELKDTANQVKFESVSENSIITDSSMDELNGKTVKVKGNTYSFDVKAKPGYKVCAISAEYTKKYTAQAGETTPADKAVTEGLAEDVLKVENGVATVVPELSGVEVQFAGTETIDGKEWAWTTSLVAVKVNSKMDEVTEDKTVTFTSLYGYEVTTGETVVAGEEDDVYIVKPGAEFFEFTVEAATEPIVTTTNGRVDIFADGPEQTETGSYVYRVVAGALANEQSIWIERQCFDIDVTYDRQNVTAEVYNVRDGVEEQMYPSDEYDDVDFYYGNEADYAYKFIIGPQENTKISKVSYTVGDGGKAEEVAAKGDSYVFYVDLTDNVHVTVETKDEYDLVVKENEKVITADKSGVYNVGHASAVTAELLKGQTNMALFNAEVKDGSAVAATIARITDNGITDNGITDNVVTLEFDSSEYNKVLTVELTLNDKNRTKKTFKVKTTSAATEVAVAGVKNGSVELPVDTEAAYKLTVKDKNATLDGLAVKVVPADDEKKADTAAITAANNAVKAKIDEDGNLVITAAPAMTGTENAAKVIIVDESGLTKEQKDALNVDNALKGGVVTVTTKDATIVGKNPTVKLVTTTDKTVKVQLGVPNEVVNPIEGKIFYKVELTVPQNPEFLEGVTDAQKAAVTAALTAAANDWNTNHLYHEKAALDKNGGLLEIPVMIFTAENEAAGLNKGVLLKGFSVKASLLQTTAKDGEPSIDATTIKGGDGAVLENIETKDPYYEVKLSLKKGTTTLITGQNKDVVVATPNFNKLTSYSTVKVEFVNTSTGEGFGSNYGGLTAKYDELQNAVIVNAKNAGYYNYYDYKNLGVKVTAYAENSAYGAVATQKITVVNGIQLIDSSAPIEIYKADNKAASFTITTELNDTSSDKSYAPKSKKLKYEIVEAADDEIELSADLKANVTVKNGKVTINKNYVVKGKAEQNRFRVKVSADDYADSTYCGYTNNITITGNPLEMGTIAVFDVRDGCWNAKLVAVNDGSITAARNSGEYRVAVLAPGVKTTKKSYDLSEESSDIMDPNLFTYKSSNAKSVAVVAENKYDDEAAGDLTINKAAKNVKITVVPKDGSKQDKKKTTLNLKNVGQAAATPLLRITRYEDSTLATETELHEGGTAILNYSGNSTNNYFKLEVVKAVPAEEEGSEPDYVPFYLANYQISYKGAKQIGKYVEEDDGGHIVGDSMIIVANAKETKITLKDKANRGVTTAEYTLVNDVNATAKAPKITTKAKLTQDTGTRTVSYTVKGGKTDNFTDKYVMLTVDRTKKNPNNIDSIFADYSNGRWETYLDRPLPIILGESFDLAVDTDYAAGNYNLVATVGSLADGKFVPEFKDAKVVVKIAKAKVTNNLSATGNYTLSMKNQSGVYLKYKSGNNWAEYTGSRWGSVDYYTKNYAKNAIINGQENRFTDYFEARYDRYGDMYIALKGDLAETTDKDHPEVPALDQIIGNDAAVKNNRIGYISINNGFKYIDVKLTITLKDCTTDKTKYKVTAAPVVAGPKAVSALTILDGKNPANVESLIAYSENKLFAPEFDTNGKWYLTATAATEKKNYPVTLYMVPENAPKAYKDAVYGASGDDAAKQQIYEKYCIKANVTVKATDKATTKNKVVVTNKGGNTWNVADTDYTANTGWSKYTPVSFKSNLGLAENKEFAVAATVNDKAVDYVNFEMPNKTYLTYVDQTTLDGSTQKCIYLPASYPMTIKLDREKLVKAIADNEALGAKKNKNLAWGKTLSVKAVFSYGTDGPVEDALTFKIKLPTVGADDAAVQEALNEAFTKELQSNIETYTKKLKDENSYYLDDVGTIEWINRMVKSYIEGEINKAIKGANVTVAVTPNSESSIASVWNVAVNATDEKKTSLYKETFTIADLLDIYGIMREIESRLGLGVNNNEATNALMNKDKTVLYHKVTSASTGSDFAEAVRKMLKEELGERASRNISLSASRKISKDKQWITFNLRVRNVMKAPSSYNSVGWYNKEIMFRLADKQKEDLDKFIHNYLETYGAKIKEIEGIADAAYVEGVESGVFTVTIDTAKKDSDVEKVFDEWRAANGELIERGKEKLAADLTEAFGDDWNEITSITARVKVKVAIKEKEDTRTITKNPGETIAQFADRYYDELLAQEDRIREKCHEILAQHGKDKLVFDDLLGVRGETQITVNYEDGSGVSEIFNLEVK